MTRYLTIAALAAFACAAPAMAQTATPAVIDHQGPNEQPILVFGAIQQAPAADDHGLAEERPIMVFGAINQQVDDHGQAQERPIYVFGAIKDRRAPVAQADPADSALPALPVVYEAPARN